MTSQRPDFIKHVSELPDNGGSTWPGRDEVFATRTPLSRPLGFIRLGVHHEVLPPGHRTSLPHAETTEEECVYVLEGEPGAWIDGERYALRPDDIVVFPPATGIRHFIFNDSQAPVRLLIVGERGAVSRERVARFAEWVREKHPEVGSPDALEESRLLELADEFEGGAVSDHSGYAESWRVGFIDHLFHRVSDFEPDVEPGLEPDLKPADPAE
jgi:uncharacterized cupin superfamily protein